MGKDKSVKQISIIIVSTLIIIFLFLFINIFKLDIMKIDIKYAKDKTTTISTNDKKDNLDNVISLFINGNQELINIKTYNSYLGYKIDYMSDYFNVSMMSNKVLMIISKSDNETYLQIELLSKKDYLNEAEIDTTYEVDDYIKTISYYRGDDIYIKVIKNISKDDKNGLNLRLEYMINTLYFT